MAQRTILQYQIVERIGVGGMGEIYKARDTRLNRFVAMKALSPGMAADPDRRLRFIQEAQAVSALNHPNIITIYDIVEDGNTQYMVVEFVDGKTLLELIPKGGMAVPQVVRYASQIAEALCAAHAAGIIHRDLKPANIMITGTGLVKVLDFGLAKMIDWATADPDGPTVTMTPAPLTIEGTLLGTVNYMSPEQAEGKKIDARSDIFSFGAVLFEMLTGKSAFRGESVISTLTSVLRDEIQPIREITPDVPMDLERIVDACLKKNPDDRVQSMQEVQLAFTAIRQQMDSATLGNVPTAAIPMPALIPARRSGPWILVVVALVALIAAGGGYWWVNSHRSIRPAAHSQTPASSSRTLTNSDIIALTAANVDPEVIIGQIRNSRTNFNLSDAELIRLSNANVAPAVIEVMRTPQPSRTSAFVQSAPVPAVPAAIALSDGTPVLLSLAQDIPANAEAGAPIRFHVAGNVTVDDAVAIRKGAIATGTIADAPKHVFGIGGKMTFRLDKVDAVDGQKIPIRVTLDARPDSKRPVETGEKKPKDVAAITGTAYTAYIDGTKTVSLRK